jgi:hypothetical protein
MKFLCIPCDEQMQTQTDGIMPKESKNISLKFKCPKCSHTIAMLTNKFETEFVSKIGVELGGQSSIGTAPMSLVSTQLAGARDELKQATPVKDEDFEWTEGAQTRIQRVPFFVRNMAKKTVISFARDRGLRVIDEKLMDEVRDKVGM